MLNNILVSYEARHIFLFMTQQFEFRNIQVSNL